MSNLMFEHRCASCGGPLGESYFVLPDRPEGYCSACIATRQRCSSCAAPVSDQHWILHDGRILCQHCHSTAVYDRYEAEDIYRATVGAIVAQLGLLVTQPVGFQLVDMPEITAIRQEAAGMQHHDEQVLGLYHQRGPIRTIYMLYGLPKLLFRTVIAHEYAHAWQAEACPNLNNHELREGFAEWVAYKHLSYLGCVKAAQQMLRAAHPYRPFLERILAHERIHGPTGVLELLMAC